MKPTSRTRSGWLPLAGIAFAISFAAVGGFYLWTEHRAQLFLILPFLLLAACPLTHLFMHHGGHSGHKNLCKYRFFTVRHEGNGRIIGDFFATVIP